MFVHRGKQIQYYHQNFSYCLTKIHQFKKVNLIDRLWKTSKSFCIFAWLRQYNWCETYHVFRWPWTVSYKKTIVFASKYLTVTFKSSVTTSNSLCIYFAHGNKFQWLSQQLQWRIQDFPDGGANPKGNTNLLFDQLFPENCMKMKEINWTERRPSLASPLDLPMNYRWLIKYVNNSLLGVGA